MKKIILCGLVILVSVSFSSLFGLYGLFQEKLADAQESFSVFDFQDADSNYGDAEKYLNYGRDIPWLLNSEWNDIKNRRLEVKYWLGHYDELINNFQLQYSLENNSISGEYFLQGNSFYRILETEKDKTKVVSLLDSAISKYADAINGDNDNLNAAFNYEYLLQVRNDVLSGKRKLPMKQPSMKQPKEGKSNQFGQDSNIYGQEGAQPALLGGTDKILIHVPTSGDELKEKSNSAGKGVLKRKKG